MIFDVLSNYVQLLVISFGIPKMMQKKKIEKERLTLSKSKSKVSNDNNEEKDEGSQQVAFYITNWIYTPT